MNILVIGSGQLGSRHLQSLFKSKEKLNTLEIEQIASENLEKNEDNKEIVSSTQEVLSEDISEAKDVSNEPKIKNDEDQKQKNTLTDEENNLGKTEEIVSNSNQIDAEETLENSEDQASEPKAILEQKTDANETKNALDSVRDAVSQSIIKSDDDK